MGRNRSGLHLSAPIVGSDFSPNDVRVARLISRFGTQIRRGQPCLELGLDPQGVTQVVSDVYKIEQRFDPGDE
jgi:hypothetical protein